MKPGLSMYRNLLFGVLSVLICCTLSFGCNTSSRAGRVIVLGLDGMDPDIVDLLMSEGKLPNFAKLRREGAYGRFLSTKPLLSPIIWTTIATGKSAADHKIGHFVAVNEKTGEQLPVTSSMRAVKALWNILSEQDRSVGVVGWWATWPAEAVNGTVISDHACYHFLFPEGQTGGTDVTGVVYPPEYFETVRRMIRRPADLTRDELAGFVEIDDDEFARPFEFSDDLSHFKWALATADTYRDLGLHLWEQQEPDVLFVYVEGVDSTSHLFGHLFRAEGLAGDLAAQQQRFGQTVEKMYEYADDILGRYIDALDGDTTLIVLSDHGFELGVLHDDPTKTRDMRRVSERYHQVEGILYMYGNKVSPRRRLLSPVLMDIAPTVLSLAGLAPAVDMPGRVLTEAGRIEEPPRRLASYEGVPTFGAESPADPTADPAILERLASLGYLDTASPKGDRNLAAIYFESGRYEEAAAAFAELLQASPDNGALRASYGGALGALGRYDEALEQLSKAIELEPLNPEPYHNRALIYEHRGDTEAAIAEYRNALRYRSDYAPSLQALHRLTGSSDVAPSLSNEERQALFAAQQASDAAKRGDYTTAMEHLDRAETLAPHFPLVYQYRSNVAFLMGDLEAARRALEKALELEPDNALFKLNLERLGPSEGE